jgi:superfamily II DNA or RNA helicase
VTATQAPINVAPGSVVVVRDEEWVVQETEETADGLLIRVRGLGELVRDTTASFYASLDAIAPQEPSDAKVVADTSPQYRTARLWLESTFRKTAVPLADPSLTVSTQALADPLVYQQTAVRKALDPANLRPRILLADAVGLGKTLEIGMILSELVRRGRGDRILIVTPRHVLEQMQQEMWARFALPFVRLDSAGIQRVRQKLPATRNPFTFYKRVIISIDTLKSDQYIANLRKHRWDAVVIDESHNVTNTASQNNKLARLLSRQTEALILASATPHNGKKESFAELIRLLDPSAIPPDGELPAEAIERLVIRRHRHSPEVASVVGADWAERQEPNNVLVPASPAENAIADELADTWLFPAGGATPYSGQNSSLFPWTLAKAFLSSAAALRESVRERRRRIGEDPAADKERAALDRLEDLADAALAAPSAKYERLVQHLKQIGVGKGSDARAVIFAERVKTLTWLQEKLPNDLGLPKDAVEVMHGGLPDDEQQRIVEDFKQAHSAIRVLVTGDVASEGVNLHRQCHELIHFDIPWSLIRIEQRNGRIDRYGQKHPPRVTSLLLEPDHDRFRGDLRVLARLMDKENEAHGTLGDVASLMGKHDVKGEEDEIRAVLAGLKKEDDVVRSVEQVAASDDLTGLFFRLFDAPAAGTAAATNAPVVEAASARTSGLYPDEVSFLEDALHAAFTDPGGKAGNDGVHWRVDTNFGTAELVPPADLAQRLDVLPQSYLADRKVTEKFVLATTKARGQDRLAAALSDEKKTSWPDAHYLAPLHPVLDWAADRALASLSRNEVFTVRGGVEHPTVLLLGTLTNRRGHIVASTWLTVAFPNVENPAFAPVEPHATARDALAVLGWLDKRANTGAVVELDTLQQLIGPAVRSADRQMDLLVGSSRQDVAARVDAWTRRLEQWDHDADTLVQRKDLRITRTSVRQEQELVEAMSPDRQLVRPLLVVVPDGWGA